MSGFGMTPEIMAHNTIDYLHSPEGRAINHVVLTTWESFGPCDVQKPITDYLDARGIPYEHKTFGYGEVREMYEGQDFTLVQATRYGDDPNQIICIEDWHRELSKSASVSLCGAFDGECIQDAEDMLTYVRGAGGYTKLTDLVVGSQTTYCPKLDYNLAFNNARAMIDDFEEKLEDAAGSVEEKNLIKRFKRDLSNLSKDPAFQLVALFPCEEVGYLYAENPELDKAMTEVIQSLDIKEKTRIYSIETSPNF